MMMMMMRRWRALMLLLLLLALVAVAVGGMGADAVEAVGAGRATARRFVPSARGKAVQDQPGTPTSADCEEHWFSQRVDHYSSLVPPTALGEEEGSLMYQERYFICAQGWKAKGGDAPQTLFFYTGNEADVTLYINQTGLMWEHAEEFGAVMVFAEHRFFGESILYPGLDLTPQQLSYLSSEQALADYATLISYLKRKFNAQDIPVIAFGGSYGGMLSSWFRLKYPHIVDGSIAASAPIWSFMGETPPVDANAFYDIVTWDATSYGGSPDACANNVRATWAALDTVASSEGGLDQITEIFSLCDPLESTADVESLAFWIETAWAYSAMGMYPFPSSYILMGDGVLPPWPVRVECDYLADPALADNPTDLLTAHAAAMGVYYNATKDTQCYDINAQVNEETEIDNMLWNVLFCSELFMPTSSNGETDMFWDQPWSAAGTSAWCEKSFGIKPRMTWASINWGGRKLDYASNIVFSNGAYDPWMGTGVTQNISASVEAIIIAEGGHHLDLMFSNPEDPQSVLDARQIELNHMHRWVDEVNARNEQKKQRTAEL